MHAVEPGWSLPGGSWLSAGCPAHWKVSMFNPRMLEPYLRLRSDTVLRERDVADVIDRTVGEMFQQYPGRQKK